MKPKEDVLSDKINQNTAVACLIPGQNCWSNKTKLSKKVIKQEEM
jgi:hypothetical protein